MRNTLELPTVVDHLDKKKPHQSHKDCPRLCTLGLDGGRNPRPFPAHPSQSRPASRGPSSIVQSTAPRGTLPGFLKLEPGHPDRTGIPDTSSAS